MDGQALVDELRENKRTELDRLGSGKALLAMTRADMTTGTVLEQVALTLDGLRTTLENWAAGTDVATAREAFLDAAASLEEGYDRVVAELGTEPVGDVPASVTEVRAFDRPGERVAAGLVGQGLVLDRTLLQVVSFFVNEADGTRADLARDLRSAATDRVDAGAGTLEELCGGVDEWDRARAAAGDVVEAAYGEYVATLEDLGFDPKPIC